MAGEKQESRVLGLALNPGDEPYFTAAAAGRLLLKHCRECSEVHHYPRSLCPFCWSSNLEWLDAEGTGVIYTYSITRRGKGAPYCIAYVTLDEGPTLMSNIVEADLESIAIGQPVRVVFKPDDSGTVVPMFTRVVEEFEGH